MDTYIHVKVDGQLIEFEVEWRFSQVQLDFLLEVLEFGVHHVGVEQIENILEMVDADIRRLYKLFIRASKSKSMVAAQVIFAPCGIKKKDMLLSLANIDKY